MTLTKTLIAASFALALSACSSVSLDEPPADGVAAGAAPGSVDGVGSASTQALPPGTGGVADVTAGSGRGASSIPAEMLRSAGYSAEGVASIYFGLDDYTVSSQYQALINGTAELLRADPRRTLAVEGNTDSRGTSEYNIALGQRRADAVITALRLLGVPATQMESISNGEEKPAVQGNSAAAFEQNRRADLFIQ